MRVFLKNIFTTLDNNTFDIARVLWALSIMVAMSLSIYVVVVRNAPWAIIEFGTGIAALLAAGGAAVWAGDKSSQSIKSDKLNDDKDGK